ncbi:MAG: UvrD-helicase domain-containing protein [Candidatus Pacebacteria bacterium]|nr:UvrD-helicase domain-containing protein [Candidatus Paceibacterota bacterium]
MNLNERQKEAVSHIEGPLLVVAGAGAGKTRVITERIANIIRSGVNPYNILAVTFTNKAAKEMKDRVYKRIPTESSPFIATFHSLGVFLLKNHHKELNIPRHFSIFDRDDSKKAIREAMKRRGYDVKQYDPGKILGNISRQKGEALTQEEFSGIASSYWEELVSDVWSEYQKILKESKAYDFDDLLLETLLLLKRDKEILDYYQNIWKYIHVDEYQDTNKVQYELIKLLADEHKNICAVGDADQCLDKRTKISMADGKSKTMDKIKEGDQVLSSFGSGDIRESTVKKVHKRKSSKELIEIKTEDRKSLVSTPNHIHFAGYRLGISKQYHFTYLMYKKGKGYRLGISQMYTKGQARKMVGFVQRNNHEHADKLWIIGTHTDEVSSRIMEYTTSLKYRIPTIPFIARKHTRENRGGGYVQDQKVIDKIYNSIDTESGAAALLRELGLSKDYPHHQPQTAVNRRRNIVITLCADNRGGSSMHKLSLIGQDKEGKKILNSLGLKTRSGTRNPKSWRYETLNKNYGEILKKCQELKKRLPDANVVEIARLGKSEKDRTVKCSLPFLPAASVRPGMVLFNQKSGYSIVKSVRKIKSKDSFVYDLDIDKTNNYIANGIITHNSIYSWRGAKVENIMSFERDFRDTTVILLEENYRSTQNILGAANNVIKKNNNRIEKNLFTSNKEGERLEIIEGWNEANEAERIAEKVKELLREKVSPKEIAILYRANFQSRALEEAFLRENISYQLVGTKFFERKEIKDMLSFIKAALNPDSVVDISRVINTPARGVGKVTLAKVIDGKRDELKGKTKEKVDEFYKILSKIYEKAGKVKMSDFIKHTLKVSGLQEQLSNDGDDGLERLENIYELASLASRYDKLDPEEALDNFLSDAALATDQDNISSDESVKLMTVHASKGLEFDYVFITGLEEGLFPHERLDDKDTDNEEERRLFYVAITRARNKVFLSYAHSRTVFGSSDLRIPSEFIGDIDPSFIEESIVEEDDLSDRRRKGIDAIFGDITW